MAAPRVATEFEKIIQDARDRKKNQELAERIFGKKAGAGNDRRSSLPGATQKNGLSTGPSLASRVGVKKRVSSQPPTAPRGPKAAQAATGLAARIHLPGTPPPAAAAPNKPVTRSMAAARRSQQVETALQRSNGSGAVTVPNAPKAPSQGLSIRGLAGPFVVMAQNFAPGTTAADIESAVTPVGGLVISCRLVKTHPIIIAEIVFESREGGERVIETFNNQTADGRLLRVYPKVGGSALPTGVRNPAPLSTAGAVNDNIVDGTMGFDEPMDIEQPTVSSAGGGRLYSDNLIRRNAASSGGGFRGRAAPR